MGDRHAAVERGQRAGQGARGVAMDEQEVGRRLGDPAVERGDGARQEPVDAARSHAAEIDVGGEAEEVEDRLDQIPVLAGGDQDRLDPRRGAAGGDHRCHLDRLGARADHDPDPKGARADGDRGSGLA